MDVVSVDESTVIGPARPARSGGERSSHAPSRRAGAPIDVPDGPQGDGDGAEAGSDGAGSDGVEPGLDDLLGARATTDPYQLFARLREQAPVYWSAEHRAWLVSRYADVAAAFNDRGLSSDRIRPMLAARAARDRVGDRVGDQAGDQRGGVGRVESPPTPAEEILGMMSEWMVLADPPAHTRLRKLAAGAFKGQRIAALEQRIAEVVDGFLDEFVAGGHTDLIEHVAYPLPATVIAEMLGAPAADRDRFRSWSDELALVAFGAGGDARADRHERALAGLREMFEYFTGLAEQRRARPADDMLSALLEPVGDLEPLRPDELVGMCSLLLFAGHETTTNSIANGVLTLLRNPEQLARLRREPELVPTAVEELLRLEGPIKTLIRWVVADHELGGQSIRAGERVYLFTSSANRDPARFTDPDTLDVGRAPNPHIAFGKGLHACIGAQLARLEMRVALGRILDRLPGLRLCDGAVRWNSSLASRSLRALHVAHDAAPEPASTDRARRTAHPLDGAGRAAAGNGSARP